MSEAGEIDSCTVGDEGGCILGLKVASEETVAVLFGLTVLRNLVPPFFFFFFAKT